MSTQESVIAHLVAQISDAGTIRSRKMFGEYALYCDEKVVALVCDDKLFMKPTEAGREFAGTLEEAPPYPGSKPFLLVEEDRWEDREWLTQLVQRTAAALPVPKPKKPKSITPKTGKSRK